MTGIEYMPGEFPRKAANTGSMEVRGDDAGNFDELVGTAKGVHLEMMSDGILWMRFDQPGGDGVVLVVTAEKRGKLFVKLERD